MSRPRLAPIAPGTRAALASQEARILASRGRVSLLYQVLLHSPPVVEGWEALLTAIRQKTTVPADLRELIILRIAVLNRAPYEFEAHVPHAEAAGLPAAVVAWLRTPEGPPPAELTSAYAEVLAYTDAMTRDIEVPDAVYAPLAARHPEQTLLEITATVAAYNMVSRLLVALRIGH
ncbi:carboxymuconolactone decarboxylase family protein [Verticiella sediminum]|uniref:Carboxymuconolactone decarboxylase family protein n=1 Tax=Verticiella sediminum TaxID=1247510 RepID=A0A556B081_9BURK|nr:carboxymuconolactone decarboxylase family protein [Verticiella sediminum]TSH98588.1 carboxymuconolactone decarboxylase family protein [Verticiella sediminum]